MLTKYLPWKLVSALLLVGIGVVSISVLILYNTTISTETSKLQALSQSHAKLINSVAQFDSKFNMVFPIGGSRGATLFQIKNAHFENIGFGKTGEFVIGELKNEKIQFLIPSRNLAAEIPPVDPNTKTAEPMRRALLGMSGGMHAPDYQGKQVLAWYEPIPDLDAGLVAKINISEIREPFKKAALSGFLIAIAVSVFSSAVFVRIATWSSARDTERVSTSRERTLGNRTVILLALIGCLTFVGTSSVASVINFVYSTEIERQKSELFSLSEGMASLIGSVADFDLMQKSGSSNTNAAKDTVSQVKRSAKTNPGFGKTGEIVLGLLEGGSIKFLLPSRFTGTPSQSVAFEGTKAEPMRRALSGQSGVIEDLDYRGERVIAAFQPVKQLNAGFVAKMDLKEIKSPYVLTGLLIVSLSIFIIVLGTLLAPQIIGEIGHLSTSQYKIGIASAGDDKKDGLNRHFTTFLLIAFAGFVFLLDYLTPLGVAAGIPYIALIIVGAFFTGERGILALTFLATVLVFFGWINAPNEAAAFWKVLTNRLYAVFTIWLAAIILLRNKMAEETIRQSETRLFSLIESAPDATLIVGDDGEIVFANQQAEMLFGYSKSEFNSMTVEALVPNEVEKRHPGLRASYFSSSHIRPMGQGLELRAKNSSGDTFPVEVSLSPVETAEGKVVAASIRDITERKLAADTLAKQAQELEQKRSLLEAVLGSINQGLVAYDSDLMLIVSNDQFRKIRDVPENLTLPGASFIDWVDFDAERGEFGDSDPEQIVHDQILQAKKFVSHSFERTRPNGTIIEVEGGPLPNGGFVSTFTDITERKNAEMNLRNAYDVISQSIQYASHIQKSFLPDDNVFKSACSEHFVLWQPRDVVGGDMYWHRYWGKGDLIILGDCTGHGVPGAFMTLIANGALDEAYMEIPPGDTASLLQRMHQLIQQALGQDKEEGPSDDGLELGACYIPSDRNALKFSGARFSLFITDKDDVDEIKGDKSGLGYCGISTNVQFSSHNIELHKENRFYMTSDGLIDQVGGERSRGFGKKRFKSLLATLSRVPMAEQKAQIMQALDSYQGDQRRRDDVAVLGFAVKGREGSDINTPQPIENLIEFDAQYSVGFDEIDDDHKKLINLINWLNQAVQSMGHAEIAPALDELIDYTNWHFRHEERLMQEHQFPELDQHVNEHNVLREKVTAIKMRFENGETEVLNDVPEFLTAWLIHHIQETDKKLGAFLSQVS